MMEVKVEKPVLWLMLVLTPWLPFAALKPFPPEPPPPTVTVMEL
jgi:hypothetical protein